MIDSSRRTVLATGAAAAAASAVPQVFAQAQPPGAVLGLPTGAKVGFYEKGNVRIRYAEIGSGFPLLATPGGELHGRQPDVSMETIEKYLHNLYRVRPDFVYSVS